MNSTDLLVLAAVAAATAAVVLAVWWERRQRHTEHCDRLILAGRAAEAPRRVEQLESARSRAQLAAALRRQVAAADRGVSPLGRAEQAALAAHAGTVRALAERVELEQVDPAALVLLHWVADGPPPADAQTDGDAAAELTRRVEWAQALIAGRATAIAVRTAGIPVS